jgi:hypothetical protein
VFGLPARSTPFRLTRSRRSRRLSHAGTRCLERSAVPPTPAGQPYADADVRSAWQGKIVTLGVVSVSATSVMPRGCERYMELTSALVCPWTGGTSVGETGKRGRRALGRAAGVGVMDD